MNKKLTVLYFGSYSLANARNAILVKGLKENGVTILECNDRSKSYVTKYLKLLFKYLKFIGKFNVMIVGFSGQEMMPLARILTRKPIIFDVFTSHYMGYILDRKYFLPQSLRAKYYHFIDRWSCSLADIVILDTQAHINYFQRQDRSMLSKDGAQFNVVFWGNFIPLQGVEYIIRAAKILEEYNVKFYLVGGGGQTMPENKKLVHDLGLNNVEFTGKLSQEDLNRKIVEADVCLGAFGGGVKTDVTIQNKIFEALAMGKAIITSKTTAIEEILTDSENCILCTSADPQSLAGKILMLARDKELKDRIAVNGYEFFKKNLDEKIIGGELKKIIEEIS
ncbi:MAG: Glycosyl transferase, group 1 [Parcubacteria group bacterium GW2011_GWC1_39_29]|nr:MAG: Glycosyl transferase, group 1 [Parcubacteria group bacterium GW2011_GWC1_39_29]